MRPFLRQLMQALAVQELWMEPSPATVIGALPQNQPKGENEMKSTFKAEDIPAEKFSARYSQPLIMNFQPTSFKILDDPEDLRKWESLLIENVGLRGIVGKGIADEIHANGGTCCESGNTNDCDQD